MCLGCESSETRSIDESLYSTICVCAGKAPKMREHQNLTQMKHPKPKTRSEHPAHSSSGSGKFFSKHDSDSADLGRHCTISPNMLTSLAERACKSPKTFEIIPRWPRRPGSGNALSIANYRMRCVSLEPDARDRWL